MDPLLAVRANGAASTAGSPPGREPLRRNLEAVRTRIDSARTRSPVAAPRVDLVVVTKAVPASFLDLLPALGATDVGENRVASAVARRPEAPAELRWHGIGHLQTNKAKRALDAFDVFHALDSLHLADRLESLLAPPDRAWPVYAQINAAGDPAKGGVAPDDALGFLSALSDRPHLRVLGLMTMAREDVAGEAARPTFRLLREIRDEAVRRGIGRAAPSALSMGMSADFEIAVEEGATVVRVGSAIWDGVPGASVPPAPLAEGD